MSIRRYQKTLNRQQDMPLPVRVEEFVSEHNSVRAIDAYVNTPDIQSLGGLTMHKASSAQGNRLTLHKRC